MDWSSLTTCPAPNAYPIAQLPSLPPVMQGKPFGADEAGHPIRPVRGARIRASVQHMQAISPCVSSRNCPPS